MKLVKIIGGGAAVVGLLFCGCFINHRINLKMEEKSFSVIGTRVNINEHKMNTYLGGEGDQTLVFMSGSGTSSPVLDFKSLYTCLESSYKIAVVEKFGYGFSDVVGESRDIDIILEETRVALEKAGARGPYVLCPHSMSGIEALYWQQKYPDEVSAIIGLDMAVYDTYNDYEPSRLGISLAAAGAELGVTRLIPGMAESDAIKYGNLTEQEKDIYKAVFFRRTMTKDMINEIKMIRANAEKLDRGANIDIPILLFGSNGEDTGFPAEYWRTCQQKFMEQVPQGTLVRLDCSHYVHDIEYKKIAEKITEFIKVSL